jgi:hypothetical protein
MASPEGRVLEVTRQELDEAVSYCNEQASGHGDAFLLEAVAAENTQRAGGP